VFIRDLGGDAGDIVRARDGNTVAFEGIGRHVEHEDDLVARLAAELWQRAMRCHPNTPWKPPRMIAAAWLAVVRW
jgi:hypothetical protein